MGRCVADDRADEHRRRAPTARVQVQA
jgi:hypothetical protein